MFVIDLILLEFITKLVIKKRNLLSLRWFFARQIPAKRHVGKPKQKNVWRVDVFLNLAK